MKRDLIPSMSTEEIVEWHKSIRPIVREHGGIPVYLNDLSEDEVINRNYLLLAKGKMNEIVDFSKLKEICLVKMLHKSEDSSFKPNVGEIIRQIPSKHLRKTVAFEMIIGGHGTTTIFEEEFKKGYYVSVVCLYKKAKEKDAGKIKPTLDVIPQGMTEEQWDILREVSRDE